METGLRRIRYFDTLARELNFRRSAEKLSITQPALSRAIAQLEYEVGARLLERTNRTVTLTLAGETFASGCQRILSGIDAAIDETQKVAKGRAGTLVVGYTDTAIAGNLPDLIRSFLLDTPDVFIRLIQLFSTQQLTMLRDGLIDVGIMTGPIDQPDLMAMDVQVDRFVALVPRGNRLAGEHSVTLAELAEFPFILGDAEAWGVYNALLFSHCDDRGVRPNIVQTAPESRAIFGLVACGLGVSVMPGCLTRPLDERIVSIPISDLDGRMTTQVVWPAASHKPAATRFGQHLAREAASYLHRSGTPAGDASHG